MKTQWKCSSSYCDHVGIGIPPVECPLCECEIRITAYDNDIVSFIEEQFNRLENYVSRLIGYFGPNSFLGTVDRRYGYVGLELSSSIKMHYQDYDGDSEYRSLPNSFFSMGEEEWEKAGADYQELKDLVESNRKIREKLKDKKTTTFIKGLYDELPEIDRQIEIAKQQLIPLEKEIEEIERRFGNGQQR